MKVLVTGFEPFGHDAVNASAQAVGELARAWTGPDSLVTAVLPVVFDEVRSADGPLLRLLAAHEPDVVVAAGLAAGITTVRLERVALNLMDARIDDNSGARPADTPVVADAPTARLASLPVKAAAAAVREAGIPARVSYSAGTYVCNTAFYVVQHALAARPATRSGFVHVPRTTEELAETGASASGAAAESGTDAAAPAHLPLAAITRALEIVVRTALAAARGETVEPVVGEGALH